MMVPRSYTYTSSAQKSSANPVAPARPSSPKTPAKPIQGRKPAISQIPPRQFLLSPAPKLSEPVVIPTRLRVREKPQKAPDADLAFEKVSFSRPSQQTSALGPIPKSLVKEQWIDPEINAVRSNNKSIATAAKDARGLRQSLSSSNPQTWDFLLSPPSEYGYRNKGQSDASSLCLLSSGRSISTNSTPSLIEDEDSVGSLSLPTTPDFLSSSRSDRRRKVLGSSSGQKCIFDHPLAMSQHEEEVDAGLDKSIPIPRPPMRIQSKASFKSNLTASFRAIRSAARSISDLSSASVHRDDLLSRSVLKMDVPYTDERRPFSPSTLEPPDPALRRYLNPIALAPAELHFHASDHTDSCKASIQLQPYQRGVRYSTHASCPPIFPSSPRRQQNQKLDDISMLTSPATSEDAAISSNSIRSPLKQREPRENGDFLRIIVLEMNMRKVGKLSDVAPGRARLWLPARRVETLSDRWGQS